MDREKSVFNIKEPIIILVGTILICVGAILAFLTFGNRTETNNKEIPTFNISLNGFTIEEFQQGGKKTKHPGNTVAVTSAGETTTYENVEMRGRGNHTWTLPKPPFQLKFSDSIDFFGLGESKTWVLLANYEDASNLRNDIAFKLADMLDEKYAVQGEFVKVIADDGYLGVYYLTHKMETKKNSVGLKDKYGVLMEVDNIHRVNEDCIVTSHNTCMTIKDTVADEDEEAEIRAAAVQAFMDDYNRYETAIDAKDYAAAAEIVDMESFAQYFLISEFSVNPDAYASSFYFYKDGLDDKLHVGPIWDFDFAFANPNWVWNTGDSVYSPYVTTALRDAPDPDHNSTREIYALLDTPEFMAEIKRVFKDKLSGKGEELVSYVEDRAALIKEDTIANADRWTLNDAMGNTDDLIDWVRRRFDYFEFTYGRD